VPTFTRKGIRRHGGPDCVPQVCADFHYNHHAAGPGDRKRKRGRLQFEAGFAGLNDRFPERGGAPAEVTFPTCGSGQVVNRGSVLIENIGHAFGRVAAEVDFLQPGAALECPGADAGNALSYREAAEATAPRERIRTDAGQVVRDREFDQAGAASERPVPYAPQAVGESHGRQSGAGLERAAPDADDVLRNGDIGQAAEREYTVANSVDPSSYGDVAQAVAGLERSPPDAGDAIGDAQAAETRATGEGPFPYASQVVWEGDAGQAATVKERQPIDAADPTGDDEIGQAAATVESSIPDAGDAVWERQVHQAAAAIERALPDIRDAAWDIETGQAVAAKKGIVLDTGEVLGKRDADQACAVDERTRADAVDAAGNNDTPEAGAILECVIRNAFDRQTVDALGKSNRTIRTRIPSNTDGVIVGCV